MTGLAGAFVYGFAFGFVFGFAKAWRPRLVWTAFVAILFASLVATVFLDSVSSTGTIDAVWIAQAAGFGVGVCSGELTYNSEVADV